MNTAVRIVLMLMVLILITALVYLPWVESTDGAWEGYQFVWAVPFNTTLAPAGGLIIAEVLAIIASGFGLAMAFWNWPRRRRPADPDGA